MVKVALEHVRAVGAGCQTQTAQTDGETGEHKTQQGQPAEAPQPEHAAGASPTGVACAHKSPPAWAETDKAHFAVFFHAYFPRDGARGARRFFYIIRGFMRSCNR